MTFKRLVFLFQLMVGVLSLNAQDKLASATPIDVKTKDAVMLKIINERESNEMVSPLYSSWRNSGVRTEGDIPDIFDIDLRGFTMPTPSKTITSPYGERWGRMHKGLDIKVYIGDTIYAAFEGKVR